MTTAGRRGILAVVIAVFLLALGAGIAHVTGAGIDPGAAGPAPAIIDHDIAMAWLARALLVLSLAWLLIGMISARTSLVRRPGAAAARASWLGATRPWRARESTLGMLPLDRWLLLVIPVALLVATRAVQSSLLGWVRLSVVIGAWAVFAFVLRLAVRPRSPWPVIAAVGGVVILRCTLTLIALSVAGPGGYWYAFWELPQVRAAYMTLAAALFLWVFVVTAWSLFAQLGVRRAVGAMLAAVGAGAAIPAAVIGAIGIEHTLAVWDERTGLLPWGLTRILAVTVRMDVPDQAVWWVAAAGALAALIGVLLTAPGTVRGRGRVGGRI